MSSVIFKILLYSKLLYIGMYYVRGKYTLVQHSNLLKLFSEQYQDS